MTAVFVALFVNVLSAALNLILARSRGPFWILNAVVGAFNMIVAALLGAIVIAGVA